MKDAYLNKKDIKPKGINLFTTDYELYKFM